MERTGMSRRGFLHALTVAAAGLAASACATPTEEAPLQEENKAISRRLIEDGWGPGDLDVLDQVIAPDFSSSGLSGLEAYKEMCAAGPFTALSERQYSIHSQFAEGDQVSTHVTLQAIHSGPLNGIPPSNKRIQSSAVVVHRIVDGKIVSEEQVSDMLAILMQIDAVPPWPELGKQAQGGSSQAEENKALVRRYIEEVWNQGNVGLTDEIISPDFVASTMRGRRGHKEWVAGTHALLPDIHESIEYIIADGDMVANRCLCTGTPEAEWLGLPPTGDKVEWTIHVFSRIVDGMIAEMWVEWSQLAVVNQLGGWCAPVD